MEWFWGRLIVAEKLVWRRGIIENSARSKVALFALYIQAESI